MYDPVTKSCNKVTKNGVMVLESDIIYNVLHKDKKENWIPNLKNKIVNSRNS